MPSKNQRLRKGKGKALNLSAVKKKRRLPPGLKTYWENKRSEIPISLHPTHDQQQVNAEVMEFPVSVITNTEHCEELPLIETNFQNETTEKKDLIQGRRIIDIKSFIEQLKSLENHGPCGCTLLDMDLVNEIRFGLKSRFLFKCKMCNFEKYIWSEEVSNNKMGINDAAVMGCISSGGGLTMLEDMLSAMEIPSMSQKTYRKSHNTVCDNWEKAAALEMHHAAEEEARLARERGDIDVDGVPLITVIADGSWCKRSYRTNYNSLSGVGAIVCAFTQKVLHIAVKNKFCMVCATSEKSSNSPKDHQCYKNWGGNQSTTGMEAAAIVEGFCKSEELYGVRYARFIGDGDSSVYKEILDKRPYKNLTVENVECKNHLLRNFCNKLRDLVIKPDKFSKNIIFRKKIGDNILRLRTAVSKAVEYRKAEDRPMADKVEQLRKDILNSPSHVFGEHKMCNERNYFCKAKESVEERNLIPDLKENGLYENLHAIVRNLSLHARSLIHNANSNPAEHYHGIVAKFIGGKRVNFAKSRSYHGRCSALVVSYNSGMARYKLHKTMCNNSPGLYGKSAEMKRKRKVELHKERRKLRKPFRKALSSKTKDLADKYYGEHAQKPDMEPEDFIREKSELLLELKKHQADRKRVERDTTSQGCSGEWMELRRKLLTASNFGRVCNMMQKTSCSSTVKAMLYSSFDNMAMKYGRDNEEIAKKKLESERNIIIEDCGLFIDSIHPFLGATPDGIIAGEPGIVEIKCPYSARDLTPEEAIKNRKVTAWHVTKDGTIAGLKEKHQWHLQIQGQLHITGKEYCLLALWTPKGLKVDTIKRDNNLWDTFMLPRLENFYKNCILPELVDPRHPRNMPIRETSD